MRDRRLDLGHHAVGCLAFGVLCPGSAVLLDHPYQLDVAGHDCGDGGDEPGAEHEVAQTRDIKEGGWMGEAAGEEVGFDNLGSKGVEDVEAPGESEESDGEVHEGRVDGFTRGR